MRAGALRDNEQMPFEGIRADRLTENQRGLLVDLIGVYAGLLPAGHDSARLREIAAHLDQTYFAWIGAFDDHQPFFYKVQSPVLLVEFDHHKGVFLDERRARAIPRALCRPISKRERLRERSLAPALRIGSPRYCAVVWRGVSTPRDCDYFLRANFWMRWPSSTSPTYIFSSESTQIVCGPQNLPGSWLRSLPKRPISLPCRSRMLT